MRFVVVFVGLLLAVFVASVGVTYAFQMQERGEVLAAENRELRLRDAARARVKGFHSGDVTIDVGSVLAASYNLGAPYKLIESVRQEENGSPLWEFGHKGKTEWIALGIPPEQWQAHECARTLNKAAWKWILSDKARAREALKSIAKDYTAPNHARAWAKNVTKMVESK